MSVKVAIRVRPFNQREIDLNTQCCIEMEGTKTILTDRSNNTREFNFDYSFWSFNGYHYNEDGTLLPDDDIYADQQKVFNSVGSEILKNAFEGYHCCLFAYGQTGSGKSYSMVGYGANKGLLFLLFIKIILLLVNCKLY